MTKGTREPCNDRGNKRASQWQKCHEKRPDERSDKRERVIASPDLSGRGNLDKEMAVDIYELR